ncbi:N-acetylmuramoyl-L-alanine amidase [Paenibacillus tarimensis]
MRIVIEAGHGPETPGKRCPDDSMREFHFNSAVAQYAAVLLKGYEDVEVIHTHEMDRDVPLKQRTDRANALNANLFVSVHANAYGAGGWNNVRGIETFVYTTRPAPAVALANAVQRQLISKTGLEDRGVKSADFHVLRESKMTAILVECGFMTNQEDAALLKSGTYRRTCAAAIVAGIAENYGLRKLPEPEVKPLPAVQAWAAYRGRDGEPKEAVMINNQCWIPLRDVGEAYGATFEWDNKTKTATIIMPDKE